MATERKIGFKTSEFWITMAGNIASVLLTVSGAINPEVGSIMAVIANGLYAISRGMAKFNG